MIEEGGRKEIMLGRGFEGKTEGREDVRKGKKNVRVR